MLCGTLSPWPQRSNTSCRARCARPNRRLRNPEPAPLSSCWTGRVEAGSWPLALSRFTSVPCPHPVKYEKRMCLDLIPLSSPGTPLLTWAVGSCSGGRSLRLSADHVVPGKRPTHYRLSCRRTPRAARLRRETEEFLLQNRGEGGRGGREHGAGDRRAQLGNPTETEQSDQEQDPTGAKGFHLEPQDALVKPTL